MRENYIEKELFVMTMMIMMFVSTMLLAIGATFALELIDSFYEELDED